MEKMQKNLDLSQKNCEKTDIRRLFLNELSRNWRGVEKWILYATYYCAIIKLTMDIGVYGLIGYEKALAIYEENRAFLDARFPKFWIEGFLKWQGTQRGCAGRLSQGEALAVAIKEGGLYGALWELCETLNAGCEIDIQRVPILQEVIEICECFDQDPYEIPSHGAFVIAGEGLAEKEMEGVTVIGHTTASKDRIILLGWDEKKQERAKRFLTPPQRQSKDLADSVRKV